MANTNKEIKVNRRNMQRAEQLWLCAWVASLEGREMIDDYLETPAGTCPLIGFTISGVISLSASKKQDNEWCVGVPSELIMLANMPWQKICIEPGITSFIGKAHDGSPLAIAFATHHSLHKELSGKTKSAFATLAVYGKQKGEVVTQEGARIQLITNKSLHQTIQESI